MQSKSFPRLAVCLVDEWEMVRNSIPHSQNVFLLVLFMLTLFNATWWCQSLEREVPDNRMSQRKTSKNAVRYGRMNGDIFRQSRFRTGDGTQFFSPLTGTWSQFAHLTSQDTYGWLLPLFRASPAGVPLSQQAMNVLIAQSGMFLEDQILVPKGSAKWQLCLREDSIVG